MAQIGSTLTLFDNMTAPIMGIVSALDKMADSFGSVRDVSELDNSSLSDMRAQVDMANAAAGMLDQTMQAISGSVGNSIASQQSFNREVQHGGGLADELAGKLGKVAAAAGIGFGLKTGADFLRDSVDLTNQRIQAEQQLVNVLANQGASYEDFAALKQEAANIQDVGMFNATSMIGAAGELSTYIKDADALKSMMGTLADYAAGMSGGAAVSYQQMIDYATQLGKALDGTYDGLKKKGFELTDTQKAIINSGSFEELIEQGIMLSDEYAQLAQDNYDLAKAMVIEDVVGQSWSGLYEQMSNTPVGQMEQLGSAVDSIRETLGAQLLPVIMETVGMVQEHLPQIQGLLTNVGIVASNVISGIIIAFNLLQVPISWVFGKISDIYNFFVSNWSQIAPVITPIGVAIGIVVAAIIAYEVAAGIAAAAQAVFNASLWACPLTWIVAAIIAVIAAVYLIVNAFNKFAGTSVSATGIVFGAFAVLGAFIWDLFLGVLDLVLGVINYLVNPFINFANFIVNVFQNPVSSVIHLFEGMADGILQLIEKIASAIDKVFGSNLAGAVTGWRTGLKELADKAVAKYAPNEEWQQVFDSLDLSSETFGLKRIDYKDAWDAGYSVGESLEDIVMDFDPASLFPDLEGPEAPVDPSDFINTDNLGGEGFSGGSEIQNDLGDTAANTGRTAANTGRQLDYSEEELKLWRDIAERDVINRFTTAEITIEQHNENHIESDMDLDGIVDYVAEGVREAVLVVAEGVYA